MGVTRGEGAAVQLRHRAQGRRQYGQHAHDHPAGLVSALTQCFDDAQPLRRLLAALTAELLDLDTELQRQRVEIDALEDLDHGLGAHSGLNQARVGVLHLPQACLEEDRALVVADRVLEVLDRLYAFQELGAHSVSLLVDLAAQRLHLDQRSSARLLDVR